MIRILNFSFIPVFFFVCLLESQVCSAGKARFKLEKHKYSNLSFDVTFRYEDGRDIQRGELIQHEAGSSSRIRLNFTEVPEDRSYNNSFPLGTGYPFYILSLYSTPGVEPKEISVNRLTLGTRHHVGKDTWMYMEIPMKTEGTDTFVVELDQFFSSGKEYAKHNRLDPVDDEPAFPQNVVLDILFADRSEWQGIRQTQMLFKIIEKREQVIEPPTKKQRPNDFDYDSSPIYK